jgi:DNA polymerase-3 subunit epsilon
MVKKVQTCTECGIVLGGKQRATDGLCKRCRFELMIRNAYVEAVTWAREILADQQAIILDSETTGWGGEVIEVSIIDVAGTVLLNTLVKPRGVIEAEAGAVHGITPEMLVGAPAFAQIYARIKQLLITASRVIAYNASFEWDILNNSRKIHNLPPIGVEREKFECAMHWYAQYMGEWNDTYESFKWQKLKGEHRALSDCLATLRVLEEMADADPEAEPVIRRSYGRARST